GARLRVAEIEVATRWRRAETGVDLDAVAVGAIVEIDQQRVALGNLDAKELCMARALHGSVVSYARRQFGLRCFQQSEGITSRLATRGRSVQLVDATSWQRHQAGIAR